MLGRSFLLSVLGTLALAGPAGALEEGVDYYLIPEADEPPAGNPVQVVYFFNFACPACFAFEGPLHLWLEDKSDEDVRLSLTPVPWERTSQLYAQTFYVLEGLDRLDLIRPFFDALHRERKLLNSQARIASWLADQQVDEDLAEEAFESFSVQTKVKRAQRAVAVTGVESTPQLVVGGRYRLSPSLSGTYQQLLATLDELIEAISEGNPPGEEGEEAVGEGDPSGEEEAAVSEGESVRRRRRDSSREQSVRTKKNNPSFRPGKPAGPQKHSQAVLPVCDARMPLPLLRGRGDGKGCPRL